MNQDYHYHQHNYGLGRFVLAVGWLGFAFVALGTLLAAILVHPALFLLLLVVAAVICVIVGVSRKPPQHPGPLP